MIFKIVIALLLYKSIIIALKWLLPRLAFNNRKLSKFFNRLEGMI